LAFFCCQQSQHWRLELLIVNVQIHALQMEHVLRVCVTVHQDGLILTAV